MNAANKIMTLKAQLNQGPIVLAPGIYDALSASLAAQAGAKALYLSGAGIAYTRLGRPDIGLVTMTEVAETLSLVRDRIDTPVIVDADNGHGNALNMQRTMRVFERAGANALQIEDQSYPKRCGHLSEKNLITTSEMTGKIHAAVDARHSEDTLIIARTDAIAVEGFSAAIDRAAQYAEAGADVLFVEAPASHEQLSAIVQAWQSPSVDGQHGRRWAHTYSVSGRIAGHRLPSGYFPRCRRARDRPCCAGVLQHAAAGWHIDTISAMRCSILKRSTA